MCSQPDAPSVSTKEIWGPVYEHLCGGKSQSRCWSWLESAGAVWEGGYGAKYSRNSTSLESPGNTARPRHTGRGSVIMPHEGHAHALRWSASIRWPRKDQLSQNWDDQSRISKQTWGGRSGPQHTGSKAIQSQICEQEVGKAANPKANE